MDLESLEKFVGPEIRKTEIEHVLLIWPEVSCFVDIPGVEKGLRYIRAINKRTGKVIVSSLSRLEEECLKKQGVEEKTEEEIPVSYITKVAW